MKGFEERIKEEMKKEERLSPGARKGFDQAYAQIRQKSAKKKNYWVPVLQFAAVGVLVAGVVWHEPVVQAVQSFFGFGEFQAKKVQESDFIAKNPLSVTDQGVEITTEEVYRDATEIGVKLTIDFLEKKNALKEVDDLGLEVRFKNEGEYISELIPDTKALKGTGKQANYQEAKAINGKDNQVEYMITLTRAEEDFLETGRLEMEIEGINLFSETSSNGSSLQKIEGTWNFDLGTAPTATFEKVSYTWSESPDIEILAASATATGFTLNFRYDESAPWDTDFIPSYLADEEGNTYHAPGYRTERKDGFVEVFVTYPYTNYDETEQLTLFFEAPELAPIVFTLVK